MCEHFASARLQSAHGKRIVICFTLFTTHANIRNVLGIYVYIVFSLSIVAWVAGVCVFGVVAVWDTRT